MKPQTSRPKIFIREPVSTMRADVLIALTPPLFMACFLYGLRALLLAVVSAAAAALTELCCLAIMKRTPKIGLDSLITGLIIALLCPVTIPCWLVAAGSIFAIAVAKMPFGGSGRNPFNPAASGWCFMAVCAPDRLFSFPSYQYGLHIPLWGGQDIVTGPSAAALLREGTLPDSTPMEMVLGLTTGPMGTTAILLMAAGGLYLFMRKTVPWQAPVSYLATCAAAALLFPRTGSGGLWQMAVELSAGSLLFCAVFMLADPVTSPKKTGARVLYGILAGAVTMLLRHFGYFEQGAPFALLICNAAAPELDTLVYTLQKEVASRVRRKRQNA